MAIQEKGIDLLLLGPFLAVLPYPDKLTHLLFACRFCGIRQYCHFPQSLGYRLACIQQHQQSPAGSCLASLAMFPVSPNPIYFSFVVIWKICRITTNPLLSVLCHSARLPFGILLAFFCPVLVISATLPFWVKLIFCRFYRVWQYCHFR